MGIVLRGGTIVNTDTVECSDIHIAGGIIDAIGEDLSAPGDEVIDVPGCLLFPGGIDPHTHFDLDFGYTATADDFSSGSKAALAGGTTTVIDYATQSRHGSLAQALCSWHTKADGKSFTDYAFHLALCDCSPEVLLELPAIASRHGVASVKLYMAYKDVMQVDDASLLKVMRICREHGIRVCLHCENGDIIEELIQEAKACGRLSCDQHPKTRPGVVEAEAVCRAVALVEITGCPLYVVHVSTARALEIIAAAQKRGLPVLSETCPQYLLLDESRYDLEGFEGAKYVMAPPLRSRTNQDRLWHGLADGTISCVGSDHCSFNFKGQKDLGRNDFSKIPNGAPGAENRFGLMYTHGVVAGRISLQQFVAATSTEAAKIFGLYPRKGVLRAGSDADIVVWDPAARSVITAGTQTQRVDYNTYEGFEQIGRVRHLFLRGSQVVKDGEAGTDPLGEYLPASASFSGEGA